MDKARPVELKSVDIRCSEEMTKRQTVRKDLPALLTTAQTAHLLNVHPNTVRNWADAALLPSYRIGPRRDRRFRRDDVEALLTDSIGNPAKLPD